MNNNINNQSQQENLNENKNENEKQESNKMAEVEKKSAAPIISVGITWIIFALVFHIDNFTKAICAVILSFIVYQIVKKKFPPKKVELIMGEQKPKEEPKKENIADVKDIKNKKPVNPELKELNERIDLYLIEVKLLNDSIDDDFISSELADIENNLKKIQVQLNDDTKSDIPKRISQLSDFFDYYMPTTIKILNSYRRIESQNLTGDNAMETKRRVEESLPFIKKAFSKELDNLFSDEMMDITTDIDVLESMLSKDGLIDKNNINNMNSMKDTDL